LDPESRAGEENLLKAETQPIGGITSKSLAESSLSRVRLLIFFLIDSILLLMILAASRLLLGKVHGAALAFAGLFLALQLGSELRRQPRVELSALDDASVTFRRACVAYAFATLLAMSPESEAQANLLGLAIAVVPLIVIGRSASYAWERSRRRRDHRSRTLVVGSGEVAKCIVLTLKSCPDYGLEVVGVVEDEPDPDQKPRTSRFFGALKDLPETIRRHNVSAVVFASGSRPDSEMIEVVSAILRSGTSVWAVPRFHELSGPPSDDLWGVPIVKLNPPGPARASWPLKRAFDTLLAGIGMLVAAPLMALVAALLVVESGRPILFRQRRVGVNGRHFDMLKFRTMSACDEDVTESEWVADVTRTTRVGRLLRVSGLDELPQLINVLRGEMSLVGPRPERPVFVEHFARLYPHYAARHRVAGGITGWSQIHGLRGDTSIEHRAAADNHYIETWSLGKDLKIVLRTLPSLVHIRASRRAPEDLDPVASRARGVRRWQRATRFTHLRPVSHVRLARSRDSRVSGQVNPSSPNRDATPADLPATLTDTRGD
jgi:exopolysaccharide biosynthesis polyprenyl glycosylphosphotransferase